MPVTTLDPNTALVVLDLQEAIRGFAGDAANPVFAAAGTLTAAFRQHGLPVILVNVSGGVAGRTEAPRRVSAAGFPPEAMNFVPELNKQPTDLVVTKKSWGAFPTTDIEQKLRDLGITQVVLSGISTTSAVESTARQAYEAGFNVTLATDAMMDMNPDAHAAAVKFTFPRLGETGTSAEIIGLLATTHA